MTRVCHLFDGFAGWEQRVGVSQLANHSSQDHSTHRLATIDPVAVAALDPMKPKVEIVARCGGAAPLAAPGVAKFLFGKRFDLIHAWGPTAAAAARAASRLPIILELFDPALATRSAKMIRTLTDSKRLAVICSCGTVRRRLIEGGVAPRACVTVRPGVDFGLINRWRREPLRRQLGIEPDDYVILLSLAKTADRVQLDAYLATTIMNDLDGGVRVITPGVLRASRGRQRIERFAGALIGPPLLVRLPEKTRFERLISICDALVMVPRGDTATTSIAWAMACETAVIGSSVPVVAELIRDGHNGLLFKRVPGRSIVSAIAGLLADRRAQTRVRDVARGQAYQVFSVSRSVEQHARVYRNTLSGKMPGEGVVDTAVGA